MQVLARHRYLECVHRTLAGEAEFSADALRELERELDERRARLGMHLKRLASVVEHRKMCIAARKEVQTGRTQLRLLIAS